jgi:hypothetical protein
MARSVMLYDDSLHDRIKRIAMSISVNKGERVTIQEAIAAGITLLEEEFPDIAKKENVDGK